MLQRAGFSERFINKIIAFLKFQANRFSFMFNNL